MLISDTMRQDILNWFSSQNRVIKVMHSTTKKITIRKNLLLNWIYSQKQEIPVSEIEFFIKSYIQELDSNPQKPPKTIN